MVECYNYFIIITLLAGAYFLSLLGLWSAILRWAGLPVRRYLSQDYRVAAYITIALMLILMGVVCLALAITR